MLIYMISFFRQSGEICFMDTSGGMDGNDMRLLLLITNSNAGGVPLGNNI